MTDISADEMNHDMISDSNSLGAVSDTELGVEECPYAKRMRMNDSFELNFADDVDANFPPDPSLVAKLKEFQVLDEVEGDNEEYEGRCL